MESPKSGTRSKSEEKTGSATYQTASDDSKEESKIIDDFEITEGKIKAKVRSLSANKVRKMPENFELDAFGTTIKVPVKAIIQEYEK